MLDLARPGLLVAGLLASLVPLALHLIARRPPERAALPTARFLAPDPRTSVRVRRRPTDPLLLALRILLLALLGAAAAGPAWIPRQVGTAELVLLDRGAGMRGEPWRAAVDAARRALLDPEAGTRGELVLFDTAAVPVARGRLSPALFDSLAGAGPGSAPSRYAAALRVVPSAARGLRGADSVRVTLLSALREEGW
ncbi:MAG TPA: BatA domain-containing protein, partial [Longimicrobiaceae bacterium]